MLKGVGWAGQGCLGLMVREADYYTAHEAARGLGISPARMRQMLRAGELEGERGPSLVEGAPGPWLVPASAARANLEDRKAAVSSETVAMPREEVFPPDAPHPARRKRARRRRPRSVSPRELEPCRTRPRRSCRSWIGWGVAWRPSRSNSSPCARPRAARKRGPKGCRPSSTG
jgi:hypothetical protein